MWATVLSSQASQHGGSLQAAGLGMVSEDPGCMTVSGGKLACGQWTKHEGSLNCYDGNGAPGAAGDSNFTAIPLDDCKRACFWVPQGAKYPPGERMKCLSLAVGAKTCRTRAARC